MWLLREMYPAARDIALFFFESLVDLINPQ